MGLAISNQASYETLVGAVEKVASVQLLPLEEAKSFGEVLPTCNEMLSLMQMLAAVAEQIHASHEPEVSVLDSFSHDWEENSDMEPQSSRPALRTIDRIRANESGTQRIADLAWFASKTLRQKIGALEEAIQASDVWRAIGQCLSSKRMAIKTGTAIEQAISSEMGVVSRLAALYDTEVERSLRVRRLYMRFRVQMKPADKPEEAEVEMRLRMASVAFARVFGERAYEDVRVQDKQLFRKLQGQVLDWMRRRLAGEGEATLRAGLRIWQEAAAFAECLMIVNNRAELRAHDKELACELCCDLGRKGGPFHGDIQLFWTRVKRLEGRDEQLDQMIADKVLMDDARWVYVLGRIGELSPFSERSPAVARMNGGQRDSNVDAVQVVEW